MEGHHSPRKLAEELQAIQSEPTATTQFSQPTQPSASEESTTSYPSMDSSLLPQVLTSQNSVGEGTVWSARGEPAILISPPVQDSALATSQHIAGLLGQVVEHLDGITRELRMMRRDMRLMKSEQRRANARVVSIVHGIEELKEKFEQQVLKSFS